MSCQNQPGCRRKRALKEASGDGLCLSRERPGRLRTTVSNRLASTEEIEAAREHCDPATTTTPLTCSFWCIIISWGTINNYNWTSTTWSMSSSADMSILFSESGISWRSGIFICSLLLMLRAYEIPHRSGAHAWGANKSGPWASKVRGQPWWERKYRPPCGDLVWRTFR